MIHFSLTCEQGHAFDGWFKSGDDYDRQRKKRVVRCPVCDSPKVGKALMAPRLAGSHPDEAAPVPANPTDHARFAVAPREAELRAALRRMRDLVTRNADYVGDKFPEEARRIHYEESDARGIYGEASREEAERLAEEGIEIFPLPELPEDKI
jgi:hypothetical protein